MPNMNSLYDSILNGVSIMKLIVNSKKVEQEFNVNTKNEQDLKIFLNVT